MKIKVCGLNDPENMLKVAMLRPDFLGMVFYSGSPRYAGSCDPEQIGALPSEIPRIGVFVDETADTVRRTAERYGLSGVQLHGGEPPALCRELAQNGLPVFKAFSVEEPADLNRCAAYDDGSCTFFVFDTRTAGFGGSGRRFDWSLLDGYRGETPFLLSGGISEEDAGALLRFSHPRFSGADLNSRFETKPGVKDAERLARMFNRLKR